MRRLLCMVAVILLAKNAWSQPSAAYMQDIIALRQMYYAAYKNKAAAEQFCRVTENRKSVLPVQAGYKAMARIMWCNHVDNPYYKLKHFYGGKCELEKAIKQSPDNVELRYLRFAVQTNTPGILNYKDKIAEDRTALVNYLQAKNNKENDPDLYKRISDFMRSTGDFSAM